MAQDRVLRAGMRSSEKVNSWPIPLRYFWSMLWGYCDDFGRGRRDARLIVADTFPIDEEVDSRTVERWMKALEGAGVIDTYEVDGKRYFECVNWWEHNDLVYLKKTEIPDRAGDIPKPGKRSEKVQKVSKKSQGKEGEVEEEREREEEREEENSPPTPFCKKHPNGTDTPCRACGNARRAFDTLATATKNKPTIPGIVTDPDCPKHPYYPARACDRCAEELKEAS